MADEWPNGSICSHVTESEPVWASEKHKSTGAEAGRRDGVTDLPSNFRNARCAKVAKEEEVAEGLLVHHVDVQRGRLVAHAPPAIDERQLPYTPRTSLLGSNQNTE